MEYDFKSLSDYDFELLCCDLLRNILGTHIENFRRGKDQGIDLRGVGGDNGTMIVQCKHFAGSSISALKRAMHLECEKIKMLAPKRYILATSLPLSPANKEALYKILQPFCKALTDIIGGNEINTYLRNYPEIERAHYKLWLTSTALLNKILHSEVYNQSEFLCAELREKLKLYVQSHRAYEKARKILSEYNCCIISGIPGIGKTTLAEILLVYYLDRGYQIIKVREDVSEAIKAYHSGINQVFLYDDFLGSAGLEMKLNKNEGKEILSLMQRFSKQKGKKFILTTREYILNQAQQRYEDFARQDFDYNKCMISLEDYTKADRARILYNHLYFHNVPKDCIANLLVESRIMNIINHPNYSPRLIESVTTIFRPQKASDFYNFFMDTLDHPNKLWETSFQRQISSPARDLLLLMCTLQHEVMLEELETYYESYHKHKSKAENRSFSGTDFLDALKEAEGTFIKINRRRISYHNPSVQDYIQSFIESNDYEFKTLCESAVSVAQCTLLFSLSEKCTVNLCQKYQRSFISAVCRVYAKALSVTGQKESIFRHMQDIIQIARINQRLDIQELRHLVIDFTQKIPKVLNIERQTMDEENCHKQDEPKHIKGLVNELSKYGFKQYFHNDILESILLYAVAWFEVAYLYSIEDFLLFPELAEGVSFDINEDRFSSVYRALEDFFADTVQNYISEMDYETECDQYIEKVELLEDFLDLDLTEIKELIYDRIIDIQEQDKDDGDDDILRSDGATILNGDNHIMDMFRSLLYRER